jgi:hypothetical protein
MGRPARRLHAHLPAAGSLDNVQNVSGYSPTQAAETPRRDRTGGDGPRFKTLGSSDAVPVPEF